MSDFIWVEKYRPTTIDECILPKGIKQTFQDFVDRGEIPNMLLSGPPGIGKTCLLYTSPSPRDLSTSRMPSSA